MKKVAVNKTLEFILSYKYITNAAHDCPFRSYDTIMINKMLTKTNVSSAFSFFAFVSGRSREYLEDLASQVDEISKVACSQRFVCRVVQRKRAGKVK